MRLYMYTCNPLLYSSDSEYPSLLFPVFIVRKSILQLIPSSSSRYEYFIHESRPSRRVNMSRLQAVHSTTVTTEGEPR